MVIGMVEDLLEAGHSGPRKPERLRRELRSAVASLCGEGGEARSLQARFCILPDGVEVRLVCHPSEVEERLLTFEEA